jgi:perosamine synthetase
VPWPGGHNFQSFVVRLPDGVLRAEVMTRLREQGIETTIGTYAVHALDYYRRKYGRSDHELPRATRAWKQCMALPIGEHLDDAEVDRVAFVLREAIRVR